MDPQPSQQVDPVTLLGLVAADMKLDALAARADVAKRDEHIRQQAARIMALEAELVTAREQHDGAHAASPSEEES